MLLLPTCKRYCNDHVTMACSTTNSMSKLTVKHDQSQTVMVHGGGLFFGERDTDSEKLQQFVFSLAIYS